MRTSIVMATFNRPYLLGPTLESFRAQSFKDYEIIVVDDGDDKETPTICTDLKYVKLNRPQTGYKCQAYPLNVGIRQATGDVLILQNPECKHITPELIEKLSARAADRAVFASTMALNPDRSEQQWYCHGSYNRRPFFFCGALPRAYVERIRGFDEDFKFYGCEDDDFAYRLSDSGVQMEWADDLLVHHQWHPTNAGEWNSKLYEEKRRQYEAGEIGIVRNLNHEWGALEIQHNHADASSANVAEIS